jgi:hypothetical protein
MGHVLVLVVPVRVVLGLLVSVVPVQAVSTLPMRVLTPVPTVVIPSETRDAGFCLPAKRVLAYRNQVPSLRSG